ncbi:MAG: hypothetical protein RLZZ71_2280 [Bacteroidota bacterium]|jgi:hypothetical protein
MKKLIRIILPILVLTALSCNKITDIEITPTELKLEKSKFEKLQAVFRNTPIIIRVFDEEKKRLVDFNLEERSISLPKSWDFANPQSGTVYAEGGYAIIYFSSSDLTSGSGATSTITAGNTSLTVNTICLAFDLSAYTALFGGVFGEMPIDGFSAVIGLDADFSMLSNADSASFGDFFYGFAEYIVYDFQAAGSYQVFDWITEDPLAQGLAFAAVFAFDSDSFGAFYFSKDGDITVNGGDMTFDGNYWGIETDFSTIDYDLTYSTYAGSGTMGCN